MSVEWYWESQAIKNSISNCTLIPNSRILFIFFLSLAERFCFRSVSERLLQDWGEGRTSLECRRGVDEEIKLVKKYFPGGRLVYDAESPELVAKSEQAVRDRGLDAAPMPFREPDPYAPRSWSGAVARVRVNFDLSSYAPDPAALPQPVRDGFAAMKAGRDLYEVVVDFAG